jgi:hypothetical protein
LIPLIATALASIFVYRHTARRRKLQALVTAAIALLFTLTLFILGSAFFQNECPRRHPQRRRASSVKNNKEHK